MAAILSAVPNAPSLVAQLYRSQIDHTVSTNVCVITLAPTLRS